MSLRSYAVYLSAFALLAGCTTPSGAKGDMKLTDESARLAAAQQRMSVPNLGDKVIGYAIVPDLETSAKRAEALIGKFQPDVPPILPELLGEVRNAMGWDNTEGLATNKPLRVLIVATSAETEPEPIALLPIKNEAAFRAQVQQVTGNDAGNTFSYETFASPSGKIYVNFIGSTAALTMNPESFAVHKSALGQLAAAEGKGDLVLGVEASNIMGIYGELFRASMAQMREMMAMTIEAQPMGGANASNVEMVFSLVDRFAQDTERAEIILSLDADLVSIHAVMKVKEGSVVRQFIDAQPKGDMSALKALPGNPGMAMVASFDFKAADGAFMAVSRQLMSGLFPSQVASSQEFSDTLDAVFEHLGPNMATTTSIEGGFPFGGGGYVQSFTVTDPEAYRAAFLKLSEYYERDDVKAQLLETYGMEVAFKADAYKIGEVPVDSTTITYDFSKMEPGMAEMMQMMGIAKPMKFDMACKGTSCFQVQDPTDPGALLSKLLEGDIQPNAADSASVQDAAKRALQRPVFFMFFSYEAFGNMIGQMGLPMGNPLGMFAPGQGLDMSLGGAPGFFEVKLNVPLKTR